MRDNNSTEKP